MPLREKDSGTKLEALFGAYTAAQPPVHPKLLGKILFGKMLNAVFPNIGPHKNSTHTANGLLPTPLSRVKVDKVYWATISTVTTAAPRGERHRVSAKTTPPRASPPIQWGATPPPNRQGGGRRRKMPFDPSLPRCGPTPG